MERRCDFDVAIAFPKKLLKIMNWAALYSSSSFFSVGEMFSAVINFSAGVFDKMKKTEMQSL